MKKILTILITGLYVIIYLVSCVKDGDKPLSTLEILQAHKWRPVSSTATDGVSIIDTYTDDLQDDYFEFRNDLTFIWNNGEIRDEDQPEYLQSTYFLNEKMDTLYVEMFQIPLYLKVCKPDKLEFEIEIIDDEHYFVSMVFEPY